MAYAPVYQAASVVRPREPACPRYALSFRLKDIMPVCVVRSPPRGCRNATAVVTRYAVRAIRIPMLIEPVAMASMLYARPRWFRRCLPLFRQSAVKSAQRGAAELTFPRLHEEALYAIRVRGSGGCGVQGMVRPRVKRTNCVQHHRSGSALQKRCTQRKNSKGGRRAVAVVTV